MSSDTPSPQLQRMAAKKIAESLESAGKDLRERVEQKRDGDWEDEDTALEAAASVESSGNADLMLDQAFQDFQNRFLEVAILLVGAEQNPEQALPRLKEKFAQLVVSLHNPEFREAMLLSVKDEHRDDVRQRTDEFSKLLWGIIDMNAGNPTDNFFYLLQVLSAQGESIEEIVEQAEGITLEDVPSEYR